MDYASIKLVHQSAVMLSGLGFAARGIAAFTGAAWPRGRLARTLPHLIDTVLLLSALTLAAMLRLNPTQAPWLMAKIVGLLVYIGLGIVALRPNLGLKLRGCAWTLALLVFAWIASVALTKNPLGYLASFS